MIEINIVGRGVGIIANQIDPESGRIFSEIKLYLPRTDEEITVRFQGKALSPEDIKKYSEDTYEVIDANPTQPQKKYAQIPSRSLTLNIRVGGKKVN